MLRDFGPQRGSEPGAPIQVLHPRIADHQVVALGVASTISAAIPAGVVVMITADVDCFIRFGGGAVVAALDDPPLWAKERIVHTMRTDTNIAGIVSAGAGKLYITPLD